DPHSFPTRRSSELQWTRHTRVMGFPGRAGEDAAHARSGESSANVHARRGSPEVGVKTRREAWVPYVTYGGTGIVGAVTLGMSALWLRGLAECVGISGLMAWSLPITVDAGGAVATVLWLTGPAAVRGWARTVAVGSLVVSLLGNMLAHLIKLGLLSVHWSLVIGVSAVYPITCWLMVHLLVLSRPKAVPASRRPAPKRPAAPAPEPQPATPTEQPPEPTETNVTELRPAAMSKREQGRAWFREQVLVHHRDPEEIRPAEVDRA